MFEKQVKIIIESCGDSSNIELVRSVSGGDINHAAYVQTKKNRYFVKWNQGVPADFFTAEVDGLRRIETCGVNVPHVYTWTEAPNNAHEPLFLVMEWIEASSTKNEKDVQAELGYQLAHLHQQSSASLFGMETDNYIGSLPQNNTQSSDWVEFFRDQRLGKQLELALKQGRMPKQRAAALEKLLQNMERWLGGRTIFPSLLHGDLWSGNWLVGKDRSIYFIDPAVYYGDREVDLAYSELFGGFSPAFYAAYQEVFPLDPGYAERKPLYQLYYLLAYLTLFDNSYGHDVDQLINRYI